MPTIYRPGALALSPSFASSALSRGERVSRDGAFTSRRGTGEGVVSLLPCDSPVRGSVL